MVNKVLPKTTFAYISLLLATAIWGAAAPVIKYTEQSIPPFTFLLLRFTIVCIVVLPIIFLELKTTKIHKNDYKNLIILGLSSQASLALLFLGIKYTSAIDTVIIGTLAPLLTIAAGHFFFSEKVNIYTKVGVFISAIGTLLVVLEPILDNSIYINPTNRFLGNTLIVLYNLLFAFYVIFSKAAMGKKSVKLANTISFIHIKPMKKAYSPMLHTSLGFYVGLAVMIPLSLMENAGTFGINTFSISELTLKPILGLLYMALLSSIVAYTAYEWGIKEAQVTDGALFSYLTPLFTIPFSYLILSEIPTKHSILGLLIIFIGVFIAEKYKDKRN